MPANTELFTLKSADYARFRPSYPETAVRWLRSRTAGEHVLDIGAGTGIFTRLLPDHFQHVSAVEPNEEMRAMFQALLPEIPCSGGTGENTKLPANSIDLITVAQAFHWLDAELFKKEALRLLRPGGKTAIIWNTSLKNDFTVERNRICKKYCPRFKNGHAGKRSPEEGDAFLRNTFFKTVEVVSFDNPFTMDPAAFEGNMRSRSYALQQGDRQYALFAAELRALFERHARNGLVTEPQETQIYCGTF